MKKILSVLLAACLMATCLVGCGGSADDTSANGGGDKPSAAFIMMGMDNPFFQALAGCFESTFAEAGYDAKTYDGQFNPDTQKKACEDCISMGVDVLIIWAVDETALDDVLDQATEQGIKVISFVQTLPKYDALMISDDAQIAQYATKFAAEWIDATYADAEDGSVSVAVLQCTTGAPSGVIQGEELQKIAQYSKKANPEVVVIEVNESPEEGAKAAQDLYVQRPDVQVFLTSLSAVANGVNNYYTGMESPVDDLSKMGIFTINGSDEEAKIIADPSTPFRGTVLTGSPQDTANEMLFVVNGIMDGSLPAGHIQEAGTTFVNEQTAQEYLDNGKVTSITADNYK